MQIAVPVAIPLLIASNVASALVFGRGFARRALSFVLTLGAAGLPWFVSGAPLVIAVLATASFLPILRLIDLAKDPRDYSAPFRFWFVLTPFDGRRVKRGAPRVEARLTIKIVLFGAMFASSCWAVADFEPTLAGPSKWVVRWLGSATLIYAMLETLVSILELGYRAAGVYPPEIHRAPILSRSLGEFWGERWNRAVHGSFEAHCFRPLARRRMLLWGVIAAFFASGVMHAWFILAALKDARQAAMMGGFFVVQGLIVLVERPLRVGRWQPALGRIWTLAWMAITVPLFVEPVARLLGD